MKKRIAMLLILTMIPVFAACAKTDSPTETQVSSTDKSAVQAETAAAQAEPSATVMDYEEFMASPMDAEVSIETYVQASERWWDGKVTLYCQSPEGGYYLYNLACTEEDAAKFVPGIKIQATGLKAQWNGNTEIIDGTVSVAEVGDGYGRRCDRFAGHRRAGCPDEQAGRFQRHDRCALHQCRWKRSCLPLQGRRLRRAG